MPEAPPAELAAGADSDTRLPVAGVRALCEFTATRGDLDRRFTPSATATEGMAAHLAVAQRRGPGYEAEVAVAGVCEGLRLRGRADGFDAHAGRLEEVKTVRRIEGDGESVAANRRALHRAQARSYAALLARQRGLPALEVAVVYYDVATQQETVLAHAATAGDLAAELAERCRAYAGWAQQEAAHRARRDEALSVLRFAHATLRDGQRTLAEAVWRAAAGGRTLLAQAPTGIGKTLGTLYPMLRAMPGQRLDKLFVVTARTPGRGLALRALQALRQANPGLPLRVLELVAREKSCEHPDLACHGQSCPLARGFYDRLPAARAAAAEAAWLDREALRTVALAHGVCPYHLGHEMVRWADVVVGDYHHWFDASGLLHGLAEARGWRVALLVDEAHNLVERARSMYSAELDHAELRRALARGEALPPEVRRALARLDHAWHALARQHPQPHQTLAAPPDAWLEALQAAVAAMGDHQAAQPMGVAQGAAWLPLYFAMLALARRAESLGEHTLCDLAAPGHPGRPESLAAPAGAAAADDLFAGTAADPGATPGTTLALRNVVPAPFVGRRIARAHSAVLFSATLQPQEFHRALLGLPADTAWLDVPSPFVPSQLEVRVVTDLSTRWAGRAASLAPLARLMAREYHREPGNYLAFFSSHDYLEQALAALRQCAPDVPAWAQTRAMDEPAREAFVARFRVDGQGIGFAVLGGAFGEGIDLPGRRLIGAFVVTLGLPQVNPVNEAMRERMETLFGQASGQAWTYLVPGLRKVVQAAGRVIRGPEDRGRVFLVDDRFGRAEVRRLLPAWWRIGKASGRAGS
jgi:DNA excision repair protein ERCC-2